MNNIASASGWRWVQGTATASLTVGRHTLEVRNREDGLNIDKIAFVPSSAEAPTGKGPVGVNCDPAPTMSSWSYWEQGEYGNTHVNYFGAPHTMPNGDMILNGHAAWHSCNQPQLPNVIGKCSGPGGEAGPGSGIAFLGMHRAMVNDFRKFALANGQRSLISLSLNDVLPRPGYFVHPAQMQGVTLPCCSRDEGRPARESRQCCRCGCRLPGRRGFVVRSATG
ncbi:MAG: hypothetical protein ABIS92_07715 [Polyangia bacterium]